ncbi:MAG TPA: hypothetical protein VK050_05805 [Flavobacteriaceae bacterium]|nr:hypothetical protein [Flavobacteriaceae bacterium]
MKDFITKRNVKVIAIVWFLFALFVYFFLDYMVIIKALIMLAPSVFITNLVINKDIIVIKKSLGIWNETLNWIVVKKIKIEYKDSLSHGAFSPSYIKILTEDGKSKKVYYRPNKEELLVLKEIVESKEKSLIIINSPYIEYE